MNAPLPPELLEALRQIDACTLANAIETFQLRMRNEGFAGGGVRCLFPQLRPMLGHAVTLKVRSANPPTDARTYLDRTDWWEYVRAVPAPRVVVVQDVDARPGVGALLGEVHLNILKALGCVGAVTNGSVRDLPAAEALGFPLFSGSVSVSHAYVHIVELGTPVEIDGLTIRSGDLLHGDRHGVQSIPLEIAAALPAVAGRITARDQALVALCRAPDLTLEQLRTAVARDQP